MSMYLDLRKTLKKIEKLITEANGVDEKKLTRAYEETLRLRSQLIGILSVWESILSYRGSLLRSKWSTMLFLRKGIDRDHIPALP